MLFPPAFLCDYMNKIKALKSGNVINQGSITIFQNSNNVFFISQLTSFRHKIPLRVFTHFVCLL